MFRKVAIGVFFVILSLAGLVSSGEQATIVAIRTPASLIAEASEALRQQIGQAMEQAARSLDLVLNTADLVYICRDDIIVVSAGVAGFEDVESSTPVLRTDVGLIYLSREVEVRFGDGVRGSRLPSGFYAVRVTVDQSRSESDPGITLIELLDGAGTAILEFPTTLLPAATGRELTASLALDTDEREGVACLDWYGRRFTIRICVHFELND
jgi:hypothetical protein